MTNLKTIWRGKRFWVTEPKGEQHFGWNTEFVPYEIKKMTAKKVFAESADGDSLQFARKDFDAFTAGQKEKVYHSKHHEYFYFLKPECDPEKNMNGWGWFNERLRECFEDDFRRSPFTTLELSAGATKQQVKQAYKRLARKAHPDGGGSHEAFLKLNQAYESAMRLAH